MQFTQFPGFDFGLLLGPSLVLDYHLSHTDGVLVITLLEDQFIFSERVGRATICVDLMGDTAQGLEIIVSFTTVNGTASSGNEGQ